MSRLNCFLMCPPDAFEVSYVINPWMEGNVKKSSREEAMKQWQNFLGLLKQHATIELVHPEPGLPDMVFTANAGLVLASKVVLSRFLHPERQGEEAYFKEWFLQNSYEVFEPPKDLPFEGAGDALLDREGRWLWAGYGFRTELDSHSYLAKWLDLEVVSLRLVDQRFYHLDTCLCPLEDGYLLYFPPAFDIPSNRLIEARVPPEKRIAVKESDATNFACNAVNINRTLLLNQATPELQERLRAEDFHVIETPLPEFMKAGGAAKCLTLRLTEPVREELHAAATVESRVVQLEGHLLDCGLLDRALEIIVDGGGSFQILDFLLGKQRQSTSNARIRILAPSPESLDRIANQLIDLGAIVTPSETKNVRMVTVEQDGVAPDDFYATTIYTTEVRVQDHWVRAENQRMDAVIVVHQDDPEPRARCKLMRDLIVGEKVAVGVEGIRTARKTASRTARNLADTTEEFGFMGSGVSSERRVELMAEQIAWDLRRIRAQNGKVVVVAGPVVIHTGGGEHLARLIQDGYIHALLGGNAIAVHDIEQALFGTSLGVDLARGTQVHGGHQHHLRAINTIRRAGSISQAVEQNILKSGIFYECVKGKVPFLLAGSIRDDGPLPETQMNLLSAQQEYAALLHGADMILMLASMLHSIGVGNMTPAGVKLVCVDINPTVVTKLADRGSIESVGIVTDAGLFLSKVADRLKANPGPSMA